MDEDGSPRDQQPFPPHTLILQNLTPLWEYGVHTWTQILGRAPDARPYFLDEKELQWANPTLVFPCPHTRLQVHEDVVIFYGRSPLVVSLGKYLRPGNGRLSHCSPLTEHY